MAQGQSLESGGSASPARDGLSYLQLVLSALAELDCPATAAKIWAHIEKNQLYKRLRVYQEDKDLRTPHRKTPEETASATLYDTAVKTQDINPKRFVLATFLRHSPLFRAEAHSLGSGPGGWLRPALVAIGTDTTPPKIYSFEIQKELNRTSEYRESFLRAVSNSSWPTRAIWWPRILRQTRIFARAWAA